MAADRDALEAMIAADVRAMNAESDEIGRLFASRHDVAANDFRALLYVMVAETAGTPLTAVTCAGAWACRARRSPISSSG